MNALTYDDIAKICNDFINDSDTTIGMECNWHDYLILRINHDYDKQDVMSVLNVTTAEYAVPINVYHESYGDNKVYLAIYDNCFEISTKEWLLNNRTEYRREIQFTKTA